MKTQSVRRAERSSALIGPERHHLSGDRRSAVAEWVGRSVAHRLLAQGRGDLTVRRGPTGERLTVSDGDLRARLDVSDPRTYGEVLRRGSVGLGDTYVEGWWTTPDTDELVDGLRILSRRAMPLERVAARVSRRLASLRRTLIRTWRQDPERDRGDIHAHYDLGNDFFELFLDETMLYSCAVFEPPTLDLPAAQRAKLDRLAARLDLRPDDHLVEIGSGWGGLAVHLAQTYGCRVTTTTISDEQYDRSRMRIAEAGLADRIDVLPLDYRDLRGTFDKLVSVEMIEAVDWREYSSFFRACERLVRPGGLIALQAIVIEESLYDYRKHRRDFVKARIFPGGCLPSTEVLVGTAARSTRLRLLGLEDIGAHYAPTLRAWRTRLLERVDDLRRLGFDERFERLWVFYLAMCEAGFREHHLSDVHVVFARPGSKR